MFASVPTVVPLSVSELSNWEVSDVGETKSRPGLTEDVAVPVCDCHGEPRLSRGRCAVKMREEWKRYYEANHERVLERKRRWSKENPEKKRAIARRYAEKTLGQGLCSYCGKRPLATADAWGCNECLDKKVSALNLLKARRRMALANRAKRDERRAA